MNHNTPKFNELYQFGIAESFIDGLYRGSMPLGKLKEYGDFGLGAPSLIDGEFTICNGKVYQTTADGQTIEASDASNTPFAFVTFFNPDKFFFNDDITSQKELLRQLETYLDNKNGMYAIRISGTFEHVKTRAFAPLDKEPFPPLVNLLEMQHFFEFNKTEGVLVGYKLPAFLSGINIEGYHFHFLSAERDAGGHVMSFTADRVKIEIAQMVNLKLEPPSDIAFMNYNFKGTNRPDLEKVEKGY
ncbi:MAG: acetolactate decarboxylase [Mucilaginibacter sp.]|uniref:acetolactate decarboxylase n=1 Tax=Mucilaginibacter sp. TaxID=1882438 RepID=UPI0031AE1B81